MRQWGFEVGFCFGFGFEGGGFGFGFGFGFEGGGFGFGFGFGFEWGWGRGGGGEGHERCKGCGWLWGRRWVCEEEWEMGWEGTQPIVFFFGLFIGGFFQLKGGGWMAVSVKSRLDLLVRFLGGVWDGYSWYG